MSLVFIIIWFGGIWLAFTCIRDRMMIIINLESEQKAKHEYKTDYFPLFIASFIPFVGAIIGTWICLGNKVIEEKNSLDYSLVDYIFEKMVGKR